MVSMLLLPLLVGILAFVVVVFIAVVVLLVFPAAILLLPLPQPSLSSAASTVPVSLVYGVSGWCVSVLTAWLLGSVMYVTEVV